MKYEPPKAGKYEDGLTAKLMYDRVNTKIRGELEEFISSYLFTGLEPGFEKIFIEEISTWKKNLENYVFELEKKYGSRKKAINKIYDSVTEFKNRHNRLYEQIREVSHLEGEKFMKEITKNIFGYLSFIYSRVDLINKNLINISPQS